MLEQKQRFISLWQRHAFTQSGDVPALVFDQLIAMYSEQWRSYHNTEHIKASIGYFDLCKDHAEFGDAIEFSIWFHDCIYELGAADNEAKSRDWFLEKTNDYLVPALKQTADVLIMDTCHISVPKTADGKLIADIDLTSFGLPWDEYMQDSLAVQSEFPPRPADSVASGKRAFLNNLIKDGQIYYSDYYLENYEHKAQENVQRHLEILNDRD